MSMSANPGQLAKRGNQVMKIECFLAEGCGSKADLEKNIQKAIDEEGVAAEVLFHELSSEEAEQKGIGGSPTVWIDGQDLEPEAPPTGIS